MHPVSGNRRRSSGLRRRGALAVDLLACANPGQVSAAARNCFSEMGIEMTAKDVLIALFDSENHHPFSDPVSAADLALKRLSDAGYAVVPVEPSDAMIEAGRLGDPLPCDVGAIWRFMVNAGQG